MKPTQAPGPHEPAARDSERRLIELRRLSVEDPTGRWFLPLASLLLDQQAISEAQQLVRHSLARDPDAIGGWVLLGRSYLMSGELAAARRIMASVLARDPENAHALRVHSQAEAELGERGAAIRGYRALLRLVPGDVGAQEALAELLDLEAETSGERSGPRSVAAAVIGNSSAMPMNGQEPRAVGRKATQATVSGRGKRARRGRGPREPERGEPRPVRAVAQRQALPPAPRPAAGIFESLPADLDWGRKAVPRSPRPTTRQAPKEGAERRSHQGYRRWLDQILGKENGNGPSAPEAEPGADA
jgi:hypothetical protein